MTPELIDQILYEHSRLKSPYKVARLLDLDAKIIWQVLDDNKDRVAGRVMLHGGEGRPELRPFLVAKRSSSDRGWDEDSEEIALARQRYEDGTHDMATGRDGGWQLLYSIPNQRRQPRPNYFTPEIY